MTQTLPQAPRISWSPDGLIEGVVYQFRADGSVDWRRLISPEFLVVKSEYKDEVLKEQGVSSLKEVDVTKVDDIKLLVLLGGWKRLLFLRGYQSLTNPCTFVTPEKAVATCTITFAPNYETRGQPVTYSWTASASYVNTSGEIPQAFLEATACNRAFSLCLRGFLNVNIVGKDEIGPAMGFKRGGGAGSSAPSAPATGSVSPESAPESVKMGFKGKDTLAKRCAEQNIPFDKVKEAAVVKYKGELTSDAGAWSSFDDVPDLDAYTLLSKLTKAQEAASSSSKTAPRARKTG